MTNFNPIFESTLDTDFGTFDVRTFYAYGQEQIVLAKGEVYGKEDVLCRIQSECISHVFFDRSCDCADQIRDSLELIDSEGTGILIYLRQEGQDLGLEAKLRGEGVDLRRYEAAAHVLNQLHIKSVRLVSLNESKIRTLEEGGISVKPHPWQGAKVFPLNDRTSKLVQGIHERKLRPPIGPLPGVRKVMIAGDLNVDHFGDNKMLVGGTAFNAANALRNHPGFLPIVFGKVGQDGHASLIIQKLNELRIPSFLGLHPTKATGIVMIRKVPDEGAHFLFEWTKFYNANEYDAEQMRQALVLASMGPNDYVFISSYLFVQKKFDVVEINRFLKAAQSTGSRIVIDLVRTSVSKHVLDDCEAGHIEQNFPEFLHQCLEGVKVTIVSGSLRTFRKLNFSVGRDQDKPKGKELQDIADFFQASGIICQWVDKRDQQHQVAFCEGTMHDFTPLRDEVKLGYGDYLFALGLEKICENLEA